MCQGEGPIRCSGCGFSTPVIDRARLRDDRPYHGTALTSYSFAASWTVAARASPRASEGKMKWKCLVDLIEEFQR